MVNERIFKPSYATELFAIAQGDYESATALMSAKKGRPENTLFLFQQAIEKAIKAVICSRAEPVPFSCDPEALLVRLADRDIPHAQAICDLTPYATIRRYEEGRFTISPEDIIAASAVAHDVMQWARLKLGTK